MALAVYRAKGIKFYFKPDDTDPSILHIFARHLTTPAEAIRTFFAAKPRWNKVYQRFETRTETHGLYWFWLNEAEQKVMVVSCFRQLRED